MLLCIMGMFSTSAFAVLATNIFSSAININVNTTSNIVCSEDGITVPCTTVGIPRVLAPYSAIDTQWPTFTSAQNITVPNNGTQTINPGVYNRIEVHKQGANIGVLIMNPGVYWVNEYVVEGQVLPGKTDGTVTVLVKSTANISGASINCNVGKGNNKDTPYTSPNRYVFYTEDSSAIVDNASISGYMYFKNSLNRDHDTMTLWGAISAESITLKSGSAISVDLDHLIFADFGAFLEVGPQITKGWHMVKAPAEISAANPVTVEDFFGDDLNVSTFRTEWKVYQRDYDTVTYKSYYTELTTLTTPLKRNRAYWLSSTKNVDLKVLGLTPVVWDKKIVGCPSKKGCYRYTLQSCIGDTNPYLYNLVGSVSSTKSDWADYRIEVDNNGTLMTPSGAKKAGIMSNQIWKYSPSTTGTYVTADDLGFTDSTIDYFEGFWVEVNCTNSINHKIDLIVPNRM